MAWTTPTLGTTFAVGEVVTAAKLNAQVADNLRWLKGLDGAITLDSALSAVLTDTATATAPVVLAAEHGSSNAPAAGFGAALELRAKSATVASRRQAALTTTWIDATDVTRKSKVQHSAIYGGTEYVYLEHGEISSVEAVTIGPSGGGVVDVGRTSGNVRIGTSGAALRFYDAGNSTISGVARQTISGSKGGNAALSQLLTALASLNLIVDSSS